MPYEIKNEDGKYCVYKKDGGEKMGCSDTEQEAKDHIAAMYANEHKSADEHEHSEIDYAYAAPDSNIESVFKSLSNLFKRGLKPGMTITKGIDGKRLMLIVTSNSYQDRDKETLTTSSLKEWVDTCWKAVEGEFATDNPAVYWHDERVKMGDIVFSDMRGPFLVEIAREDDSIISQKMFDYISEHPEEKWGASHKFAYYKSHKDSDGTFHHIIKKETSVLPRSAAANVLTFSGVIPMTDKRSEYLNKMLGLENAAELLDKGIDVLVSELNKKGIEHKSTDKPEAAAEAVKENFGVLMSALIDAQTDLDTRIETQAEEIKALKDEKATAEKAATDKAATDADALKALSDQVAALKAQLDSRPRQGSQSPETKIDPANLSPEIKKNMTTKDPLWGTEVTPS